ncbi:TonB-dependent siderophore receptor [Polaromonas sp. SM01]|uniref:TonB-dependent receptor n=1 Tax=Polaromonas sp. SM01 TaxID=3085630 RepID=UPI002981B976|nr:TonB-dependent siderophore receptor [Polaromonas sp. SM01]MDW5444794.1 TonB-dependent siderophore receptor [Polaromonas sp. SM01]
MNPSVICIATSALILSLHTLAQSAELPTVHVLETGQAPNSSLGLDVPSSTGSRLGLTPRDTPASITSISSADLEERNITRVQDAVKRMPGFTDSASAGNGGTGLTARGFSGHNSVAQMIDGTRLVVGSGTVTFPFSTWPYESIEALRGPASVLYGDGSIGAAVNYITKQPLRDRREHEAFFTLGSHGTVMSGVGSRGPINDTLAYSAYVSGEKSNGFREDNAYSRQNYSLALLIQPNSALKITLSADGARNKDATYQGTPLINGQLDDRLRRTSFNVQDALVKYDDQWLRAKVEFQASDSIKLRNETYVLTSERHWRNTESYTYVPATGRVTRGDYLEILHDLRQTGNRFDATFDGTLAGMKNRFVAGFDVSRVDFLNTNNSPYGGSSSVNPFNFVPGNFISPVPTVPGRQSNLDSTAFFAENALDLTPQWKLVAGLRQDRMTLDSTDLRTGVAGSKSYSPLTGRLGAVWRASAALSLYGQYATGTDPLSGALSLPANLAHDLTKGKQLEFGAKGDLPSVRGEWTASVYRIEKRNLLSRDAINPLVTQQIGQQSSTGVELALAMVPVRGWSVDANLAMLRARYDNFKEVVGAALVSRDGNQVANVPERTANLWTSYRFAPQWQAGVGLQYVGERAANPANTLTLPAYTTVDALLRYEVSRNLNLALSVSNLTDKDYAISGSANSTGTANTRWLLGAPRTVYLTARVKL